jgi:hypothetical protein
VCVYTERDGGGDQCHWDGDDTDWMTGINSCEWADDHRVESVFSHAYDTAVPRGYVALYHHPGYEELALCLPKGEAWSLHTAEEVRSHRWVARC